MFVISTVDISRKCSFMLHSTGACRPFQFQTRRSLSCVQCVQWVFLFGQLVICHLYLKTRATKRRECSGSPSLSLIASESGNTKITCPLGNKAERMQTAGWEWDQRSDRSQLRVTHSVIYQTGVNRWRFFFLNQSQSWIFATPPFIHLFSVLFFMYTGIALKRNTLRVLFFVFSFIIALVLSHRFYNWNSMRSDCLAQELVSRYGGEYRLLQNVTSHTRGYTRRTLLVMFGMEQCQRTEACRESCICGEGCTIGCLRGTKIPCLCASPLPYSRQNVLVFN